MPNKRHSQASQYSKKTVFVPCQDISRNIFLHWISERFSMKIQIKLERMDGYFLPKRPEKVKVFVSSQRAEGTKQEVLSECGTSAHIPFN